MDWTLLLLVLLVVVTADLWFGFLLHRLVSYFWYKYAYPESETKAKRPQNNRRRQLIAGFFWFWIVALVVSLTARTACDEKSTGMRFRDKAVEITNN